MKILTATEVARGLSQLLDRLEAGEEEVVIVRNNHPVAKLVPGAPRMNALEALSDLHGILDDREGEEWLEDIRKGDRMMAAEQRDPWA
ncbi:MAG TPA: type II toxin-antitoxin system Phd/YefM family antitoxin [Kiritimatiellia bacterium]|nr:type II toxin-antitoxin system Phd/YefM family antitoxin [Kiritimatiellia bacterium]HMP00143.1 type II toxin-antitoxin system Phd/YefM family antitoxin [Kiritimatiellia bacterium]HMP96897.1 type II toxin-antitoxin system Phd/YefM family antitoxin [Kiritimatiellia bacterium]